MKAAHREQIDFLKKRIDKAIKAKSSGASSAGAGN
jgi:hypothetical protein